MATLESLMQAVEIGRQRVEAQKQKEESQRFNFGSAFLPMLASIIAAPFTGGASLGLGAGGVGLGAALGESAILGAGSEAIRASNPQGENTISQALLGQTVSNIFPSKTELLKQKLTNSIATSNMPELNKQVATVYPEEYAKSLFKPSLESQLFIDMIDPEDGSLKTIPIWNLEKAMKRGATPFRR